MSTTITNVEDRKYKIYFKNLPSRWIFNYVGYTVTPARIAKINARTGFYRLLEESILEKGIRNPILVCAGWPYDDNWRMAKRIPRYLPDYMKSDYSKLLICDRMGGSRLYFAQQHGMDIPCLLSDFCGRFENQGLDELITEDDIRKTFNDQPGTILFDDRGVDIRKPNPVIKLGQ